MLQVGDKMPSFAAVDETGKMVTEKDLIGKKTVIYFYPKDSTPGCTAEACNIRDNYHAFLAQGYQVYGVSKDSQASHIKFKEKYDLPFPLLSDPTTEMLQAFGAWGEKKNVSSRKWTRRITPHRFYSSFNSATNASLMLLPICWQTS